MNQKTKSGLKIISNNRKARFNYFFEEFFEAGIALQGSEVKSLRDGKVNISDSYAFDHNGEIYLVNSHIPLYKQSSYNNHNPRRNRKLLLNKKEINKLIGRINREGFTLIPTKLYFKKGKANISESYAFDENGEIYLVNSHIPSYKESSYNNHDPKRNRKLLLNKREINKLLGRINREGFTLIPTKLYFKKGKAKIEIAVAKGKKQYDKRHVKKQRDWNREKARFFRKSS